MKRRNIVIILAVLLLGGGVVVIPRAMGADKKTSAIKTSEAKIQSIRELVSSSGKTSAEQNVDLKFQTSGLLQWVGVKEGDTVTKGQVIATLDQRDVRANLEKALRDYSAQRNDFEQLIHVTYDNYTKPETAPNDTIKRILQKNQWDLEKAVLDVELKHLSVTYSMLVSPIDGVVAHIDTPVSGINITPAGAVFRIINPESIVFRANIDETDVGKLVLGQKAEIILDAYADATFSGTVKSIAFASESTSGGATIFPVEIALSANVPMRVGLNGDVNIIVDQQDSVLVVDKEAVRIENDVSYVYKKVGDTYEKVQVTTGISNDETIAITSGISAGDSVVVKGFADLPKK